MGGRGLVPYLGFLRSTPRLYLDQKQATPSHLRPSMLHYDPSGAVAYTTQKLKPELMVYAKARRA
eukprot:2247008-Pyramimonas_sp.AAC.1